MSKNETGLSIPKAIAGDQNALHKLILHYYPDVTSFAKKVCANPQDAEDATQHTLSVMWNKISFFRQEAKLTSWLYTIVKNECVRLKNQFLKKQAQHLNSNHYSDQDANAEAHAKEYLLNLMTTLISKMKPDHRQVIVLHELEGLSLQHVSEKLEISLSAAKTRVHRARLHLKDLMESEIK